MLSLVSLRSLSAWLRPLTPTAGQRSGVCSTCQALATLHRRQVKQRREDGHPPRSPRHSQAGPRQQPLHRHLLHHLHHAHLHQPSHATQQHRLLLLNGRLLDKASEEDNADRPSAKPLTVHDWGYRTQGGVGSWLQLFGKTCSGELQSPIDLDHRVIRQDPRLSALELSNFFDSAGVATELENTGHSAQVNYVRGDLRVSGGGLGSTFRVAQFHFHWGSDDSHGSEHTVDGRSFPMEMHVVTYNTNYGTFANALNYHDGLAVLGIFYKVGKSWNEDFAVVSELLSTIEFPGSKVAMPPFALGKLLPSVHQFYRYQGGLTTPPCSEVVAWTVFKQPVAIATEQLEAFRRLQSVEKDAEGKPLNIVDNFRPVQPLSNRVIGVNF